MCKICSFIAEMILLISALWSAGKSHVTEIKDYNSTDLADKKDEYLTHKDWKAKYLFNMSNGIFNIIFKFLFEKLKLFVCVLVITAILYFDSIPVWYGVFKL